MVKSQGNLLPSVPDQKDPAAARKKYWADPPSPTPNNLDLALQLSLTTGGHIEFKEKVPLCKNSNSPAMKKSTTLPPRKRKREVPLTDKDCHYKKTNTMKTEQAPPLKLLKKARRGRSRSPVSSTVKPAQKEKDVQEEAKPSILQGAKPKKLDDSQSKHQDFTTKEQSAAVKQKDSARFAEQAIDAKPLYKCNECGKSFPTHQALGGRNRRNPNGAKPQEKKDGPLLAGDNRCKARGITFPTGQALGGHQRLHYVTPTNATTSTLPTSQENANFDLNQLPELEEADDDFALDLRF